MNLSEAREGGEGSIFITYSVLDLFPMLTSKVPISDLFSFMVVFIVVVDIVQ